MRILLFSSVALTVIGTVVAIYTGQSQYLLPFYTFLANFSLGLILLISNFNNRANQAFSVITFAIAVWTTSISLYWYTNDPVFAFWCSKIAYASTSFIPSFLIFFSIVFPGQDKPTSILKKILIFSPIILILILDFANQIVIGVEKVSWGLNLVPGRAYPIYSIYFLGYMVIAFVNLIAKYRKAKGQEKKQIANIFFGFLIGSSFPIVTNLIMPSLGNTSLTAFGPSFSIILTAFITYSITKHRLMDISVVISRTTAWAMTVILLGVIYLGLAWLSVNYVSASVNWFFLSWSIIYGIIVGEIFQRLRLFFQTTSDKLFLRGKYDYYKELSDVSTQIARTLSMENILNTLNKTFNEIIEVSNPRIYLRDDLAKAEVKPLLEIKEVSLRGDDLVVPCRLEDRLIAILVLGKKLSEDPYTEEDIRLLRVLSSQVAVAIDHTSSYEKIKVDLEAAERQLERSQRLASLGTLTAGVTHEIRNPLTVIRGETERLPNQPRDLDYLKNYRDLMLKHIDRISGIVQRMLGLAKEKKEHEVDVNLNDVIDGALPCFDFSRIVLKKELRPVPAVKGNPDEFQEVFVNLIQNALDAMTEKGGELTLRTFKDDGHVIAEVADTGKGIPAEIREKIFDPFYSTRHEGVGLGLSIVYRIVREHGGSIKVESEVGKGTTFRLQF